MPAIERPRDRATRRAEELLVTLGRELREARLSVGLSQMLVGAAVGLSPAEVSRIERGKIPGVALFHLVRLCSVVGLDLSARAYPTGRPIRDRAHLELLGRLRTRIGPGLSWQVEVPIPIAGDLRAWDAVIGQGRARCGVEAETSLRDLQALERRISLKKRDSQVDVVILVVRDTRWNRGVIRDWRELIASSFPGNGQEVLANLSSGRLPNSDGLILL